MGEKAKVDPFNLQRFVEAQANVYPRVVDELRRGRKTSHWMWFVFPQISGLGFSEMSQRFAIGSLEEAKAYLAHPVLGARLRECAALVLNCPEPSIARILGAPDDMKFHSCMTLFAEADPDAALFQQALQRFFGGARDAPTMARLVEIGR